MKQTTRPTTVVRQMKANDNEGFEEWLDLITTNRRHISTMIFQETSLQAKEAKAEPPLLQQFAYCDFSHRVIISLYNTSQGTYDNGSLHGHTGVLAKGWLLLYFDTRKAYKHVCMIVITRRICIMGTFNTNQINQAEIISSNQTIHE